MTRSRSWVALASGVVVFATGLVQPAMASTTEALLRAEDFDWGSDRGVRCETRNRPRAVGARNYVIDRVTECTPFLPAPGEGAPNAQAAAPVLETPVQEPADRPETISEAVATVRWVADRSRLENAQYARSLRAMRGVFQRRSR